MTEPEDPQLIAKYHSSNADGTPAAAKIIAMGVGGGGCNAVAYMHSQGVRGVDFVVLNTDSQALMPLPVATKVLAAPSMALLILFMPSKKNGMVTMPTVSMPLSRRRS